MPLAKPQLPDTTMDSDMKWTQLDSLGSTGRGRHRQELMGGRQTGAVQSFLHHHPRLKAHWLAL